MPRVTAHWRGLGWALVGVVGFSLTLPATRVAVAHLPAALVGTGRGVLAALGAATVMLALRQPLPARRYWGRLAVVAFCTVIAFPLLIAQAMRETPAGHAAVVLGVAPLLTAALAVWRGGESPSPGFWFASAAGSFGVIAYALQYPGATVQGELLLVAATVSAAIGYAEGGRLAREIGGMRVVTWSLVCAAPFLLWPALRAWADVSDVAPAQAWGAFLYLGLVSQWLAFYAWYRGLALAGVAHAAQTQQLQVFFTLGASALWLGEQVALTDLVFALWVIWCVALAQRFPLVERKTKCHEERVSGEPS